jgi:hypothetical protein
MGPHVQGMWRAGNLFKEGGWDVGFGQPPEINRLAFLGDMHSFPLPETVPDNTLRIWLPLSVFRP